MPQTYTVQSGDTLSGIGDKYGVAYQDIAKANNIANPNLIYPGQTFTIPGAGTPTTQTPQAPVPQPQQQSQPQPQPQSQPSSGGDSELDQLAKTSRNPVQETRYQELLKQQGPGGTAGSGTNGAPTFDLVAATNAAFNTPEIKAAQQAITDRQLALTKASANINDDPFYSESKRLGEQAKLTLQANNDIKVQQDILASLKADAQIKVNAAQGQYNIDSNVYKENLNNFNNLMSQGALDNASASDLANFSVQTGIPVKMIQSMIKVQVQKDTPQSKVQIVQATDNEGNLTLLGVDQSGTIINQTTIPGAGKAAKTSTGTTKKEDTQNNTDNLITSIKNYNNLKNIVGAFSGVMSLDDIYRLYNTYSPFGPAQNTLKEVKAGTIDK